MQGMTGNWLKMHGVRGERSNGAESRPFRRRCALQGGHDMSVRVQRQADSGVAKRLHDRARIDSLREQEQGRDDLGRCASSLRELREQRGVELIGRRRWRTTCICARAFVNGPFEGPS